MVDTYSKTASYSVGQLVLYNYAVYECIEAVSNGSFSLLQWQKYNTYSDQSAYAAGDLVFYNGNLFKCLEGVGPYSHEQGDASVTFEGTKWEGQLFNKVYYPSYKTSGFTELDDIYYKISYLASLEGSHFNYYDAQSKPDTIPMTSNYLVNVDSFGSLVKVYLNVNYAPSQADVYQDKVYTTIKALFDFEFDFEFLEQPGVNA